MLARREYKKGPAVSRLVTFYPDEQSTADALAGSIVESALLATRSRGLFLLVLAGGRAPLRLYEVLSRYEVSGRMPWAKTHVFMGDERWVPHEHEDSNFGQAYRQLLSRTDIPGGNIHPIPTSAKSARESANSYQSLLESFFLQKVANFNDSMHGYPVFDLVILGLGSDGHTASLFAGDPALYEKRAWVRAVASPKMKPSHPRVTLTMPVINSAREIAFHVSSLDKLPLAVAISSFPHLLRDSYPAARVNPQGQLTWFIASPET